MAPCFLCKSTEDDEIKYGKYMKKSNMSVHYFCLLLSSNLLQQGNDDEGFLGFLQKDIRVEAKRCAPQMCFYCHKNHANISCCASKCRRSFHLVCGIKNNCLNTFVDTYQSFCHNHAAGEKRERPKPDSECTICYDSVGKYNPVMTILAPCCRNGWFHKLCLANFALTAGYFFKCPLCNNSDRFRERLVMKGVYIPDKDAEWELEPNAYAELLERPDTCVAKVCKNRRGRKYDTCKDQFVFCNTCGSQAIHRKCLPGRKKKPFKCTDCSRISGELVESAVEEELLINAADESESEVDENAFVDIMNVEERCSSAGSINVDEVVATDEQNESDPIAPVTRRSLRIRSSSTPEGRLNEETVQPSQSRSRNNCGVNVEDEDSDHSVIAPIRKRVDSIAKILSDEDQSTEILNESGKELEDKDKSAEHVIAPIKRRTLTRVDSSTILQSEDQSNELYSNCESENVSASTSNDNSLLKRERNVAIEDSDNSVIVPIKKRPRTISSSSEDFENQSDTDSEIVRTKKRPAQTIPSSPEPQNDHISDDDGGIKALCTNICSNNTAMAIEIESLYQLSSDEEMTYTTTSLSIEPLDEDELKEYKEQVFMNRSSFITDVLNDFDDLAQQPPTPTKIVSQRDQFLARSEDVPGPSPTYTRSSSVSTVASYKYTRDDSDASSESSRRCYTRESSSSDFEPDATRKKYYLKRKFRNNRSGISRIESDSNSEPEFFRRRWRTIFQTDDEDSEDFLAEEIKEEKANLQDGKPQCSADGSNPDQLNTSIIEIVDSTPSSKNSRTLTSRVENQLMPKNLENIMNSSTNAESDPKIRLGFVAQFQSQQNNSNPGKRKRNNVQRLPHKDIANQTKIESFFKRI